MAKRQPIIAITGANGYLGKALVNYFTGMDWQVLALVRQPERQPVRQNVTYVRYDLATPANKLDLSKVDYLVHTAYVKAGNNPDAFNINVNGARNLLTAIREHKLKHAVFISTMSAHKDALSAYGKQKLAIEQLFNGSANTVLKCGLIIGNGGIVNNMSEFMCSKHVVPLIGGGTQPLQIVAVDDLVRTIDIIFKKRLAGSYVIATPQVYSYKEFYQALAHYLKIKVLYIPVPFAVLQLAFKLMSVLGIRLGVGQDNLLGLKMLRAMESRAGLERIGITLMDLDQALAIYTKSRSIA